jgi:hypothetical protein
VISKRNRIYAATRAISVGSRRWRTIPGAVFFLPDEAPRQIAEVTAAALGQASRSSARDHRGPGGNRPALAASRVRGLLGWICWGDDVDGDLAESQRDTWSGLHA